MGKFTVLTDLYLLCIVSYLAGYIGWYDTRATHPLVTYIIALQLRFWVVMTVGWTVSTIFCLLLGSNIAHPGTLDLPTVVGLLFSLLSPSNRCTRHITVTILPQ